MEKLIITCCVHDENPHWPPDAMAAMPKGIQGVAESIRGAHDAGAAIVHAHMPHTLGGAQGSEFSKDEYLEFAGLVRRTDVIWEYRGPGPFQCGFAGRSGTRYNPAGWAAKLKAWRDIDLSSDKPDMVNCIVGPQHFDKGKNDQVQVMPTLDELESHMQYFRKLNIKVYFEIMGANSLYNIRWLINKGLIDPPYWLEIAMGIQGPTVPPANIEELLYVTKRVPEGSKWLTYSALPPKGDLTPQELRLFLTQAITLGGHVRCGMEGNPYYWDGSVAKSNGQIIESIVRIARDIGREVATSAEARQMLELPKRGN